jgi:predicted dehydrogenase
LTDVQVVGACRRDQQALNKFCDHFEIPGRFADFHDLLQSTHPDAVVIASPHALHHEQARECLRKGIHVLVEKPLALNSVQAADLCQIASEQNRVLAVALNPPYWAHCHLARQWIAEGRIGTLEAVEISWLSSAAALFGKEPLPEKMPGVVRPTSFRSDVSLSGGGQLMDGGQHTVSELLWVTGRPAMAVSSTMDSVPQDMRSSVSVVLDNRAVATLMGVADSRIGARRAHSTYYGSEGTIRIGVGPFRIVLERPGKSPETVEEPEMPIIPTPVEDLVRCIRSGDAPLGSPGHALETTRVIEAAYRSSASAERLA